MVGGGGTTTTVASPLSPSPSSNSMKFQFMGDDFRQMSRFFEKT